MNPNRLAIAALAAAVALAGCGGGTDTTKQYKKDAKSAISKFRDSTNAANAKIQSSPTREGKLGGLEQLKTAVNTAADDFAGLKPPDKAKADNSAIVSELHNVAGDIDSVETAIRGNNAKQAKSALPKLQTDLSNFTSTAADLRSKIGN